jgi:hypothetical protein
MESSSLQPHHTKKPAAEESRNCAAVSQSISNPQQILPVAAVALEAQASAIRNVQIAQRSIALPLFPARSHADRNSRRDR